MPTIVYGGYRESNTAQGNHLSGEPGNVGEFYTCLLNVRNISKN